MIGIDEDDYVVVFDYSPNEIRIHPIRGGQKVVKKFSLFGFRRRRYLRFRVALDLVGEDRTYKAFFLYGKRLRLSMGEFNSLWKGK